MLLVNVIAYLFSIYHCLDRNICIYIYVHICNHHKSLILILALHQFYTWAQFICHQEYQSACKIRCIMSSAALEEGSEELHYGKCTVGSSVLELVPCCPPNLNHCTFESTSFKAALQSWAWLFILDLETAVDKTNSIQVQLIPLFWTFWPTISHGPQRKTEYAQSSWNCRCSNFP